MRKVIALHAFGCERPAWARLTPCRIKLVLAIPVSVRILRAFGWAPGLRVLKEVFSFGGDVTGLVPPSVLKRLRERISKS
jgi:hypothetical protein